MDRATRDSRLSALPAEVFDVVVVGGGVHGGAAFRALRGAGYRALLVERGDYACGTSQSSTMMAWGGLIYLKNGDLGTVWRLSRSRDELLARERGVSPLRVRYVGGGPAAPPRLWERAALHLYWALGGCRRRRPALESSFAEQELLRGGGAWRCLTYEEGRIGPSDARFVLRSIVPGDPGASCAFNYCQLHGGGFDPHRRCWHLELEDRLAGRTSRARARWVVNAAGVGADPLNAAFGVEAPYRHLFSKGVFLGLPRHPAHDSVLAFAADFLSWCPWGPCALWGPTETVVANLGRASAPEADDVRYLLGELNRYTRRCYGVRDIISLRCGVRPIAVRRGRPDSDSRTISRRARLVFDRERPWVSVYGGNLTYAPLLARRLRAELRRRQTPARRGGGGAIPDGWEAAPQITFPGLPGTVPAPEWCAAHEECWHLEDYLRRRTNIAQWVPRAGLGAGEEHRPLLERLARDIYGADEPARKAVDEYAGRAARDHHCLVGGVDLK
jgi:glycerol-3-phosphate dehydrogenase